MLQSAFYTVHIHSHLTLNPLFNTVKYSFFNTVASHNFWGGGHVIKRELVGQIIVFITATDVFFLYHSYQIPSMYVLVCLPMV